MRIGPCKPQRYVGKCRCGFKASVLIVELRSRPFGAQYDVAVDDKGAEHNWDNGTVLSAEHDCKAEDWLRWAGRPKGMLRPVHLRPVRGTFAEEKICDGRCMSATGTDCECSCRGRNHGAAHAA
jgi:hypothetical protein